jgi:divalent metal cation (Fe/Co/Zn/Cd) transporter
MYKGTYSSPYSSTSRRRHRDYHLLGLVAAAMVMAVGTTVIVAGVMKLQLWQEMQQDTLAIILGCIFIGLIVVCLAVYSLVRAIGWVFSGFAG